VAACALALPWSGATAAEIPAADALRAALLGATPLRVDGQLLRVDVLRRFYEPQGWAPVWGPDAEGAARAAVALETLAGARDHGLDPVGYGLAAIRRRGGPAGVQEAVERELLLTDAILRYALDVHAGQVRPAAAQPDWGIAPPPREDPLRELAQAVETGTLAAWLEDAPPPHAAYARLVEAMRALHAVEARGGWPTIPPGPPLAAGRRDARLALLRGRLVLGGDLEPAEADDEAALDRAIRRAQTRHALEPDGVAGADTVAALNVPVRTRIRQVAANLERWRWLPRRLGARHVVVNAADATLTAAMDGRPVLTSRVVVGDELHPTPVARSQVGAVVFNPPWNVPTSIVVEEFLPKLRANPRFLADNDIVILDRPQDPYGLAVDWTTVGPQRLPFRLQQRPGGGNPLGRIRFATPNRFDVYLHDTPLPELFLRRDRALSHGCVRVERAHDLLALVLSGQREGRPDVLQRALASGATRTVVVADPWPVYLLYWTAFVDDGGRLHFRDDVYDRDARVLAALARGSGGPTRARARVAAKPARPVTGSSP
jgi:murein L,D-transpeptidase YcbB/YkuD